MALISLTRLQLRSARFLPAFLWHTWRSARQMRRAPGFLVGRLGRDSRGGYWTVSAWSDRGSMLAYRNSGAHMRVMPKLLSWGSEASFANWEQDSAELPGPDVALERIRSGGRTGTVRHPSPAHAGGRTARDAAPVLTKVLGPAGA